MVTHLPRTNLLSSRASSYVLPRDSRRCWPIPSPAAFYGLLRQVTSTPFNYELSEDKVLAPFPRALHFSTRQQNGPLFPTVCFKRY